MSSREKIIVVVVALCAAYGLFDFLRRQFRGTDPSVAIQEQAAKLSAFIDETRAGLQAAKLTPVENRVIERANRNWASNPFFQRQEEVATAAVPGTAEPQARPFRYTAFLSVGDKRMAIVDGMEYGAGDTVAGSRCVVQSIEPDKLVLLRTNDQARVEILAEVGEKQ
jgi:hypothetical protein